MREEELIVKIANVLREMGRNVGIDETLDAINAIRVIEDRDPFTLKAILKATLIKNFQLINNEEKRSQNQKVFGNVVAQQYLSESNTLFIYSPSEAKGRLKNFKVDINDITKWKNIANNIRKITLSSQGHRFKVKEIGTLDIKRTLQREAKYEGDYPNIIKSKRKITKSNIILLCDVSGSMIDFFKESVLLSFFLKRVEKRTEIFYFSTDIKRVTNFFQVTSLNQLNLRGISSTISYGSGTRIGEALQELKRRYGYCLTRRSSVVVFSDAWDLGNIELLKKELKDIRKRCLLSVWINPLMDSPSYSPATETVKIVNKNVDLMISPSSLNALM